MKKLIVSIHDVTPAKFDLLRRIDDFLSVEHGLNASYSMLVVPDYWHGWPLDSHPDFAAWLRGRAAAGVEMILHGYYHKDDSQHQGAASFKAAHMTAGEGEFLGLSRADANDRITRGRGLVEGALGRTVEGFIAPAWLYGEGALAAVADQGFAFAEDHWKVWAPKTGRKLAAGPVISYASRSRGRIASSLLWSRLATTVLKPFPVVRLAIHPNDFTVPALIAETRRALAHFLGSRQPALYRDLLS